MPGISYQLYCSRDFGPLEDTLKMVADAGYDGVEGYGPVYEDAGATRGLLDRHGLTMPTGHFALTALETEPQKMIEVAKTLGVEAVIVPFVMPDQRPSDAAGWTAFGHRLAEAGKPVQDAGFQYGWHNHDFEFKDMGEGDSEVLPLDLIMGASDDLKLELDLGWTIRAGQDPLKWLDRMAGRIIAAHVKDIAPQGENTDEDGWADVGHGTVDWAPIHAKLQDLGVNRYVIEHDKPADDARMATRSIATVKGWN